MVTLFDIISDHIDEFSNEDLRKIYDMITYKINFSNEHTMSLVNDIINDYKVDRKKLCAVKNIREISNLSLLEAKKYVERFES